MIDEEKETVEDYIVIDDDIEDIIDYVGKKRIVKTSIKRGLTNKDVRKIIRKLKKKQIEKKTKYEQIRQKKKGDIIILFFVILKED